MDYRLEKLDFKAICLYLTIHRELLDSFSVRCECKGNGHALTRAWNDALLQSFANDKHSLLISIFMIFVRSFHRSCELFEFYA